MINQYEVPALIEDALPQLRRALRQFPAVFHMYDTLRCFSSYLQQQLRNSNYPQLGKCLQLTGRLYEKGNPLVRNAVLEIILLPLSRAPLPDNASSIKLYALIPASVYHSYMQYHLNR